ncbi:MAG: VCBS repeat-containing protein [Candidatus Eisenbacteria bacterium]
MNDGKGHFSLGPKLEPFASTALPVSGATFGDVNRDGKIDLFVVGWYENYGASYVGHPSSAPARCGRAGPSADRQADTAGLSTTTTASRPSAGTPARP